jgi:glycosyltransferase involved in cell wall biosynthesis
VTQYIDSGGGAFVALEMKNKWDTGFLFDMRGFYPDERIDGGIWNMNNIVYKLVYNYFKKVEHKFLLNADHIISLTHAGKKILKKYPGISRNMDEDITVIPCCVDTEHFNSVKEVCSPEVDKKWICYVGSLGTWYLLEDMVRFMSNLHKKDPSWNWLILTRDSHDDLLKYAAKHNLPEEAMRIKAASRAELPILLSTCEASIFFIKSTFSKQASSPTKQGEVMAMGLPLICNAGVGDSDAIVQKWNAGVILRDLSDASIEYAVNEWLKKVGTFNPSTIREGAIEVFSLDKGVASYFKIYKGIISGENK